VLALAIALFAFVTAARFAFTDPTNGVGSFYLVPICVVAAEFGVRAAIAASGVATAIVFGWSTLMSVPASMWGNVSRLLTFAAVGALVGVLVRQRDRLATESSRWFTMSNGLLCVADLNGNFVRVNPTWAEKLGYTEREMVGRPLLTFVHPDDRERTAACTAALAERPSEVASFENRYRASDGTWRWLSWTSRSDGERIYAMAKDVTDRKRADGVQEAQLRVAQEQARSDHLTGLANRRVWDAQLPREIARSRRNGSPLSVAMIDLDGLKALNDSKGHHAGSSAIKHAASMWAALLRASDVLARFGGDEFAVIMPDCAIADARAAAERLRLALDAGPTASIGVAEWDGAESGEALVARADAALYEAKRAGRNRVASAGLPGGFPHGRTGKRQVTPDDSRPLELEVPS
jgi:diguanylate cyclase (GGDEF)-like protein/PAS domain S-box-containing protein